MFQTSQTLPTYLLYTTKIIDSGPRIYFRRGRNIQRRGTRRDRDRVTEFRTFVVRSRRRVSADRPSHFFTNSCGRSRLALGPRRLRFTFLDWLEECADVTWMCSLRPPLRERERVERNVCVERDDILQ